MDTGKPLGDQPCELSHVASHHFRVVAAVAQVNELYIIVTIRRAIFLLINATRSLLGSEQKQQNVVDTHRFGVFVVVGSACSEHLQLCDAQLLPC